MGLFDAFRLDDKVAIVTGASRGLGKAMALALAEAGADLVLVSRSKADLDLTAKEVEAVGRRTLVIPTDVSVFHDAQAVVEEALATFSRIDVLVNNAGVALVKPLIELAPEEWERVIATNLTGTYNLCRAAGPHLVRQQAGKVINIASVLGDGALPGYAAYAASKAGIIGLTRVLAVEWARFDVQVNCIAPGWFVTPMNESAFADERTRDRLLRDVPARRTGRPEELGPLVVYLASAASDYMTGEVVFIDGGAHAT
jgi:2-deoxy-D-gluconate 3-dehydrogenase